MTRRSEYNEVIRDLDEILASLPDLGPWLRQVLTRDRFSPGQRRHYRGELGEMEGTPPPHYGDQTGDDAVWSEEVVDAVTKYVRRMASAVRSIQNDKNDLERMQTTNPEHKGWDRPNCLACGLECKGRVSAGFCRSCYRRWNLEGRPDRVRFMALVKSEIIEAQESPKYGS